MNTHIALPLPITDISLFISHLASKGFAPATTLNFISALSYVHKLFDVYDSTKAFVVRSLLTGYTKLFSVPDSRLPNTKPILHKLMMAVDATCSVQYNRFLLKAMFCTSFYGFMRTGDQEIC